MRGLLWNSRKKFKLKNHNLTKTKRLFPLYQPVHCYLICFCICFLLHLHLHSVSIRLSGCGDYLLNVCSQCVARWTASSIVCLWVCEGSFLNINSSRSTEIQILLLEKTQTIMWKLTLENLSFSWVSWNNHHKCIWLCQFPDFNIRWWSMLERTDASDFIIVKSLL